MALTTKTTARMAIPKFYEGCIAYVQGMADQAYNGIGVETLIKPDPDLDDDNK